MMAIPASGSRRGPAGDDELEGRLLALLERRVRDPLPVGRVGHPDGADGSLEGMPESIRAAEAELMARTSWGFSWSAPKMVPTMWTSLRKPFGKEGAAAGR